MRLRLYGHVKRNDGWTGRIEDLTIEGRGRRGRQKKIWRGCINEDLVKWGLCGIPPADREGWRSMIQTAMNRPTHL